MENEEKISRGCLDLIYQLDDLHFSDGDFFGKDYATQCAYEKANDKVDECISLVWEFYKKYIAK